MLDLRDPGLRGAGLRDTDLRDTDLRGTDRRRRSARGECSVHAAMRIECRSARCPGRIAYVPVRPRGCPGAEDDR
jgi:hypothetical protein